MSAGVRAGAEGHSRPPAANARQSSSQRAELLLGGRLTTSGSGGPCARQSLGQEVLESQGALPGGRPSLSPAPRGPPTRTTHCGPQEPGRRGGGGITEPREFIGSHPPLSGSLTAAGLTGNYFGVKFFGVIYGQISGIFMVV